MCWLRRLWWDPVPAKTNRKDGRRHPEFTMTLQGQTANGNAQRAQSPPKGLVRSNPDSALGASPILQYSNTRTAAGSSPSTIPILLACRACAPVYHVDCHMRPPSSRLAMGPVRRGVPSARSSVVVVVPLETCCKIMTAPTQKSGAWPLLIVEKIHATTWFAETKSLN